MPQVQEPLTHVSLEAHACPHCPQLFVSLWVSVQLLLQQLGVLPEQQTEPQTFAFGQHVLLMHCSLESQQKPPQHRPEQQVFTVHGWPAAVQGVTHWPFWQFWPEAQQCAPV